jgi:thiosulfate/3-mercaptopyruvate sulfurtransferase
VFLLKTKEAHMSFHDRYLRHFSLIAALVLLTACATPGEQPGTADEQDPAMDTLVTVEWLNQHLDDPDLVVLDCTVIVERSEDGTMRNRSGLASYKAGHIPTAGFADLKGALSDPDSPLDLAMPTPEQFAAAMGALGVGDDSRVVLYSASYPVWAARVWWMLRWIGFDRAALLDGGLKGWTAAGYPLSDEPADRPARILTPRVRPELIADRDEVLAAIGDDNVNIIDSMPAAHYRGEMAMYARPGHIAGASNIPVLSLLDDTGRYRPQDELAAMFDIDPDTRSITYCGGGIAASSVAFVMTRLGYTDVAVYAASLQEWAADPANPMETSPDPEWSED